MMKRTTPLLLWTVVAWLAVPMAARAVLINRVVLRVNDQIATLADYEERKQERTRALLAAELEASQRQQLLQTAGRATMRSLFDELLLISRAEQLGVNISEADLNQAVSRARDQAGITNDEEFQQALAQSGLTLPGYREQMRRNLLMDTVIGREVRARIDLDEQTLRRHYRQHSDDYHEPETLHLQEVVLLESNERSEDELRRIAGQIAAEVAGGRSLADASTPWSHAGVATAVVDLGWVGRGDLDAALAGAAWDLAPGDISAPVRGRGGLHLLELIERREARLVPFEEVREQVRRRVGAERFQKELEVYLEDLAAKAYVVAEVPADARGFRQFGEASAEQLTENVAGTAVDEAETDAEVEGEVQPAPEPEAAPAPETPPSPQTPPDTPQP